MTNATRKSNIALGSKYDNGRKSMPPAEIQKKLKAWHEIAELIHDLPNDTEPVEFERASWGRADILLELDK